MTKGPPPHPILPWSLGRHCKGINPLCPVLQGDHVAVCMKPTRLTILPHSYTTQVRPGHANLCQHGPWPCWASDLLVLLRPVCTWPAHKQTLSDLWPLFRAPWYFVERKRAFPDLPLPNPNWLRKVGSTHTRSPKLLQLCKWVVTCATLVDSATGNLSAFPHFLPFSLSHQPSML